MAIRTFFFRLSILVFLVSLFFPASVVLAQTPPKPEIDGPVQTTWDNLLTQRLNELDLIRAESTNTRQNLPEKSAPLLRRLPELEEEFKQLSGIAQVTGGSPVDLSVVQERTRRLNDELDELLKPLENSAQVLEERLARLLVLEENASETANLALAEFHKKLQATRTQLGALQKRLAITLAPAKKLQEEICQVLDNLDSSMPEQWRDYYLAPSGRLFEPKNWVMETERLRSINDILSLRLNTEFPQSALEWTTVGLRSITAFLLLLLLLHILRRSSIRAGEDIRPGLTRLLRRTGPWIAAGLALHYAAWSGGKFFQVIATVGTVALCWGQMSLAWELRSFQHPGQDRVSPLWPMFVPLLVGMGLLFLDPFPLLLAALWLLYTGYISWRHGNQTRPVRPQLTGDGLSRGLLTGFAIMCWLGIAITFFGYARLSILLCMAYTAVAVCIQQDIAILQIGNMLEKRLPLEGHRAFAGRILLALLIPTILLVATITPVIWILAYPGGAYLLRHVAGMGVSIGEVSLNAAQLLSIVIAFYLTRSLISVGLTFIRGLKRQGRLLEPGMLGPVRTAYTYGLWLIFGLYVLRSLGFSLSSLAFIAGGLSVGIGLGLQNMVQNFISGLTIIFGQIIKEGDVVDVGNITGATVRKITIRATQLETSDNATVFVPNNDFLANTFTNWTHNNRKVRKTVPVSVAYEADTPQCLQLLQKAAEEHPRILTTPAPSAIFNGFGATAQDLLLIYWIADWNDGTSTLNATRLRIKELFAENGIEISFPASVEVFIRADNTNTGAEQEAGPEVKVDQ